jgi:hypothetical protein
MPQQQNSSPPLAGKASTPPRPRPTEGSSKPIESPERERDTGDKAQANQSPPIKGRPVTLDVSRRKIGPSKGAPKKVTSPRPGTTKVFYTAPTDNGN